MQIRAMKIGFLIFEDLICSLSDLCNDRDQIKRKNSPMATRFFLSFSVRFRCMDRFHAGLTNPFYQSSSYFHLFHVPSSYCLHLHRLWYQFTDFLHWLSRIYASNLCEGSFTKSVQESYWFDFLYFGCILSKPTVTTPRNYNI